MQAFIIVEHIHCEVLMVLENIKALLEFASNFLFNPAEVEQQQLTFLCWFTLYQILYILVHVHTCFLIILGNKSGAHYFSTLNFSMQK